MWSTHIKSFNNIHQPTLSTKCLTLRKVFSPVPLGILTKRKTSEGESGGKLDSAKNYKRQRRKRQSVTAKREKLQTPKFV